MPWVSFLISCSAFYELAIIEAFFVPLRINFENFEIQNIWMFSGDNNGFNTSDNRLIDNCLMYLLEIHFIHSTSRRSFYFYSAERDSDKFM